MKSSKQQALELAYLMLFRIAAGKSFSALQYHGNLALIKSEIPVERLKAIETEALAKN